MNSQKRKLKPKEVRAFRKKLLKEQSGKCLLCGGIVPSGQDQLDHDHETGLVRGVLHARCNSNEGRVMYWAKMSGMNPIDFLEAVIGHCTRQYDHMPLHRR